MKKYRLSVLLLLLIGGLVSCKEAIPVIIPNESHEDTIVISSSIDINKTFTSIKDTYKTQYMVKGIKIDHFPDEDKPGQFEYNENALLPSTFMTLDDISTMDLIVVSTHELVSNAVCRITKIAIIYGVNS